MDKINSQLLKPVKRKEPTAQAVRQTTSLKLYWKKFFSKKTNIFAFVFFLAIFLSLIIALFFVKNSATKSVSDSIFVNNLPSYYNQIVTRSFDKGETLNFIRKLGELEKARASELGISPIFEIYFDSAYDTSGQINITTDIVILQYNPYKLLEAMNINLGSKIEIPQYILGTNQNGVDIYSRSILSIFTTIIIITISLFGNILIGFILASLYSFNKRKWWSKIIDVIASIINSVPTIIWIFIFTILFGTKPWQIMISFLLVSWASFYELTKNEIEEVSKTEFIIAAKAIGLNNFQVAKRHLFTYILPSLLILFVDMFTTDILIISSLAFLEFINETNNLNIGMVIKESISMISLNISYLIVICVYISLFSISLKLLSNSLSSTFNPKI
ncbi:ABC transporter permease subunit [Metamycoplasma hyosynoviae]|uniref:ABC transporter permease subunit n=1 Tax=Metamycoplasma hyosynoviae TaxID=29559 RepID=UPI0023595AE0|nr:ABC transporter permease subunit [Metamycoplasma hyosynoviae]MDC8911993.1 ABC transporter permease subunit [Metamycoplasma hyosynoviae]MDD1377490.1 ABC transporter permease subunit [Metamycoplasma hyosynoviae]MDD7894667.1 ABC transporter permease subunit [Metamycoplasma hyosynoviae]MDD7895869.1 ABC transporter permease subunit [Metamycoplasma hyosynoviae]MDD7897138.1 ABC transporter permease subunit [Metamycoplasma hyosynoviae]